MVKAKHHFKFALVQEKEYAGLDVLSQWMERPSALEEFYRLTKLFPDLPLFIIELDTFKIMHDNGRRFEHG